MKVKIFHSCDYGEKVSKQLEEEVNNWISNNPDIVIMSTQFQSCIGDSAIYIHLSILIVYKS